jgi:class 3 adenylate cyclase
MHLINLIRAFFWSEAETDSFYDAEESQRRYILFKYTLRLTIPLTFFYAYLFFHNESYINAWVQLINGFLFLALLNAMMKAGKISNYAGYYGILAAISIYCTIYYTGGLYSLALPWIISHAPTVILLAGKRNGFIWWILDFMFVVILAIMHYQGYTFPSSNAKFTSTIFNILNSTLGLVNFMFLLSMIFEHGKNRALYKLNENNKQLTDEKERSEKLLLNILPEDIANELKRSGKSKARLFESATVLFTDFVNFTGISENLSPEVLVDEIDTCFTAFDNIIERHGLEKIKTIGDSYMAAAGVPIESTDHAHRAIRAAQDIVEWVEQHKKAKESKNEPTFGIRVGINSGSLVAGIVGHKKFAYDIWGDTVNTASRMEQNSEPGKINITSSTYALIKKDFTCVDRGLIDVKHKGMLQMFFVR